MKRNSVTTLAVLLASCALPPVDKVDPNIVAEMDAAARQAASNQSETVREALLPPLRAEIPKVPATPLEPRFDLVVNAAQAPQVFMSIVSGTRYSMVVNPEVSGRVSLNLKDVTVLEALEAIREVYGYEFRVQGTRIYVESAGLQTRVFQVNYLSGLRTGRSDLRVSSGTVPANVPGQAGGIGVAPVAAGPQTGQGVNAIGLGQLNQTTNDATRVSTFSQSDLWQELTNALRTLVGTGAGRNVVVSPQSGVVVVRAMPQEIRGVENYLKAMRVSVERQVMLEAKIIDVTLNNAYQAGVNWAGFSGTRFAGGVQGAGTTLGTSGGLVSSSPLGLASDPGARTVVSTTASGAASAASTAAGAAGLGVFGLALQTKNFAALLQFLESQGTTQVLSSPRVATLNNQKAVLKVGTDDFFITNVKSTPVVNAATGVPVGATLEPTLSSFFSGVSLDITPQIDEDGNINLHIHPLVSRVENGSLTFDFGTGIGTTSIPTAKSTINETDTVVRVQDGNIVALGGLMQLELENSRSGVPGVQDVPGVGELFGNRARNVVKKELVILIKPTIIKGGTDWEQDVAATAERLRGMRGGFSAPAPGAQ
jgi:MSHA biogenesis protein MshL